MSSVACSRPRNPWCAAARTPLATSALTPAGRVDEPVAGHGRPRPARRAAHKSKHTFAPTGSQVDQGRGESCRRSDHGACRRDCRLRVWPLNGRRCGSALIGPASRRMPLAPQSPPTGRDDARERPIREGHETPCAPATGGWPTGRHRGDVPLRRQPGERLGAVSRGRLVAGRRHARALRLPAPRAAGWSRGPGVPGYRRGGTVRRHLRGEIRYTGPGEEGSLRVGIEFIALKAIDRAVLGVLIERRSFS